jgi:hypothetical protein
MQGDSHFGEIGSVEDRAFLLDGIRKGTPFHGFLGRIFCRLHFRVGYWTVMFASRPLQTGRSPFSDIFSG